MGTKEKPGEPAEETPAGLNDRGMALTSAERYDEAVAAFTRALDLDPGNPVLIYNRGEAWRRAGRLKEARSDLESVLAIQGEEADLLLALGLVAYEDDDFDLGVVRFRRGQYEKARLAFEKAVELSPDFGDAWFNLRDTYEELGLKREFARAAARVKELGADPESD